MYNEYLDNKMINILSTTPTYLFLPLILCLYRMSYNGYHLLLSYNQSYTQLHIDRQYYIIFNIAKSNMLLFLSYLIYIGYTKDIIQWYLIDWSRQLLFKNITTLYVVTDLVPLFVNRKKMMVSTIIHHICVVCSLLGVLSSNLENIGVSNAIILYGIFSSLAFFVNFYLGIRFIIKDKVWMTFIKKITFVNYIIACISNWSIQSIYLLQYVNKLSILYINNNVYILNYMYLCLHIMFLYFWISDDIILMRFLLK